MSTRFKPKFNIKKGDNVVVITGEDKDLKKPRKVLEVILEKERVLSGIRPTGLLHLGNYFGAMLPSIQLQDRGEALFFIADYHSMTSLTDAKARRRCRCS